MTYLENVEEQIAGQLAALGRYMMERELAWGNSGNISARIDDDQMLITASGTYMGSLGPDDFARVDITSGAWQGERKPSKEIPMHTQIYRRRKDAKVILHSSPFWSTLVACSDLNPVSELFIESMYYLQKFSYVDYFHPGSVELGEAVGEKATESNVIFMKNHGIIVFDDSFQEARMRLESVEMACRMAVTARSAGIGLHRLAPEVVQDFLDNSGYKPKKPMAPAG